MRYQNNDNNCDAKYLNKFRNKSYVSKSVKKGKRNEIYVGNFNMGKKINELKNTYRLNNYEILFLNKNKKSFVNYDNHIKSQKNKNNFKINKIFVLQKNKIKIEREELNPVDNNQFVNNLNKYQTEFNISGNLGNDNKEQNNEYTLKNKKLNQEEELEKYKKLAQEEEKKRINLEQDVVHLQMKLKEMSDIIQDYEKEFKIIKKYKIKELDKEINNKIIIDAYENNKKNGIKNSEEKERIIEDMNKENSVNKLKEDNDKIGNDSNNKLKDQKENIKNNNNLNEKLKQIEKDCNKLKEENKNLKIIIQKLKKGINTNKIEDYKIDFFRGNISNLVNSMVEKFSFENIPNYLQRAFMLNDSIFNEEYFFKGIFPKIVVSTKEGDENNIIGLCSLYYESNEDIVENSILRINSIFSIEDSENQIIKMIDFIKNNMKYKRLEIYLLYDKIENKFIPNKEAKEIFQKKLGFKWLCVVRDEKLQQRYIKLYYSNENESQENIQNGLNKNNNFCMDSLTIITINNEQNSYLLKNIINNKSDNFSLFKPIYNKFINPNPIYSLINYNPIINKEFIDTSKIKELNDIEKKLWKFVNIDVSWNEKEEDKKQIKEINFDIDNSIYKQIKKYFQNNSIKL